jgi:hypothetical protein
MRILIDMDITDNSNAVQGYHYIDPESPGLVAHPDGSGQQVDYTTALTYHSQHPELHDAAGYLVTNQLPGEDSPMTRWDRFMAGVQTTPGNEKFKANLREIEHGKSNKSAHRRSSHSDK